MSLIKWTPYLQPFEEMEKFLNGHEGFAPAVNVYETKDAVVVEASLAGVDPEKVEVSVEDDVLTIKGETSKESEVDDKNYYRKEVRSGSFFRSVALPAHVLANQATAESAQGLLKITVPKIQETKSKTIKIDIKKK